MQMKEHFYVWNPVDGTLTFQITKAKGDLPASFKALTATPELLPLSANILIDPEWDPFKDAEEHQIYSALSIMQSAPRHIYYWAVASLEKFKPFLDIMSETRIWVGAILQQDNLNEAIVARLLDMGPNPKFVICKGISDIQMLTKWIQPLPIWEAPEQCNKEMTCLPALPSLNEVWIDNGQSSHSSIKYLEEQCRAAAVTYRLMPTYRTNSKQTVY